jgi:Bacterial SH3 domain
MDARRFDGFARALARGRSRRGVLRGLAALTAGGVLARGETAAADGDGTEVQGAGTATTGTGGACVPVTRPVSPLAAIKPPFPALIVAGTCETPDLETTYSLFDVATDTPVGSPVAATVAQSATTVRVKLDDLIKKPFAILVRVSESDDTAIACGEIGGLRTGDDLTIGIRERNASSFTGIGWLRGSGASTLVYVFLGRGLSTVETASAAAGSTVVTTADVNLRAEPSENADVVAVVPAGTALTVTGASRGDWLPVKNPETGDEGYVSAQYVALQQ